MPNIEVRCESCSFPNGTKGYFCGSCMPKGSKSQSPYDREEILRIKKLSKKQNYSMKGSFP